MARIVDRAANLRVQLLAGGQLPACDPQLDARLQRLADLLDESVVRRGVGNEDVGACHVCSPESRFEACGEAGGVSLDVPAAMGWKVPPDQYATD